MKKSSLFVLLVLVVGCGKAEDVKMSGPESDATLASLEIVDRSTGSPIALEPAFDPAVTSYRATSTTGTILDVRGQTTEPFFIVVVGGVQAVGTDTHRFTQADALQITAPEQIVVSVTANDGQTVLRYTVDVVDPATDTTLTSLSVTDVASGADVALTPAFDPAVSAYQANVAGPVPVRISGRASQPNATVTIDGTAAMPSGDGGFVSGDLMAPLTAAVVVTAADGTTTSAYTIEVQRGGFLQVSAASIHTCAIRGNEEVVCWGGGTTPNQQCRSFSDDDCGQALPPAGAFTKISAGEKHTCGIRTDGTVACWGAGTTGDRMCSGVECGQSTPPAGTFLEVTAGIVHTCGIRDDRTVACWGGDRFGQLGSPMGQFATIDAGRLFTCAIRTSGEVVCWGEQGGAPAMSPSGTFTQIAAGEDHACAIRTDRTVACWGSDFLGNTMAPAGTFLKISAGMAHTCALRADQTIACWGAGADPNTCDELNCGQSVPPAGAFISLSAGEAHTCGVHADGRLSCWGLDEEGRTAVP